jgi:glycosyltransferase involved in cell wall biosynthesis
VLETNRFKNLILFTTGYPFGWYETVFLQNEIKIASKKFNKVLIVYQKNTGKLQPLPSNVQYLNLEDFEYIVIDKKKLLGLSFSFLINWFKELLSNKLNRVRLNILKNLWNDFSLYKDQFHNFNKLKWALQKNEIKADESLFYTYWFDSRAIMMKFLKEEFNTFYITRAHGFDLYKERSELGYISFRSLHMKTVDKIFCVSKSGSEYLRNQYEKKSNKISYSRLGSEDFGLNPFIEKPYHIVSCSSLFKVKRVHLIVDILKHMKEDVLWTHIGSGSEQDNLLEKIKELPSNIKFQQTGELDNNALLSYYKTTSINLLLNVSEYEGLPFSIIEAISFGIPCIATDVGGTKEAVTEETGLLLNKDFDGMEVALLISDFLQSDKNSIDFRKTTRKFWEDNYNYEINFINFYNKILDE